MSKEILKSIGDDLRYVVDKCLEILLEEKQ